MINPERQHNALSSLEVLFLAARAGLGFYSENSDVAAGRADAERPQDLSDEALRLRISTLEADIRDAGRTPRGPSMTNLNRQLDTLVAELRRRRSRSDAVSSAYREGRLHAQKKGPSGRSDNPWIGHKERDQWEAGFESWF